MSMADKIAANAASYLEPGEQVQGAFAVQKTLANKAGNGGYRAVVATDRRIMVFQSGTFSQTKLKKLLASLPRDQRLGPGGGAFHSVLLGEETMLVNFRYFKQLDAIDAALDAR
jgi:hypothetical protein